MLIVAKTLVTGSTGFIGSHVARKLASRGDELKLTIRKGSDTSNLKGLDYEKVTADILDRRALGRAMKGVDRVFHVAGSVDVRSGAERLFDVNVIGTRNVLSEALRAGVERVVYTSSVAAVGPAMHSSTTDEENLFTVGRLGIPYVNSKREGEIEALRIAAQGLPVVVVNPTFVLGRGDNNRSSTYIVDQFLKRQIPVYVNGGLNVVDVEDVARGHLYADKKGKVGERYILGNRNYSLDNLFAELSRLSGVEPPAVKLPYELALRLARAAKVIQPNTAVTPEAVEIAGHWWNYKITKAKRDLGYKPGDAEKTIQDTIEWYLEKSKGGLGRKRKQPLPFRLLGRTVAFNSRLLSEAGALIGRDA